MPFVARKERRLLEAARRDRTPQRYFDDLREALESKAYRPSDFRIRALFEAFVDDGHEAIESWNPGSGDPKSGVQLLEAGVTTGAFANIMGQIVYTEVMTAFDDPVFLAPRLARNVPTKFNGEKIPGIGRMGDEAETVPEGHAYPTAGFTEEWIATPATTKRGFIVPVTKEAIFFDRTGLVLERAREVSQWLAVNKEKRVMDAATGQTNQYRKNDGAAIATYGDSSGAHDWDNLAASNGLVDWTDIENARLLFDGLVDPNTGEPIIVTGNDVLVPSALNYTAKRIFDATEFRYVDTHTTLSRNPLAGEPLNILSNAYVKARTSSASTWFIGDFMNAFWYMENWPITSVEAPPNSELEFSADIVARYKVSERGAIASREPRRVIKCTA